MNLSEIKVKAFERRSVVKRDMPRQLHRGDYIKIDSRNRDFFYRRVFRSAIVSHGRVYSCGNASFLRTRCDAVRSMDARSREAELIQLDKSDRADIEYIRKAKRQRG